MQELYTRKYPNLTQVLTIDFYNRINTTYFLISSLLSFVDKKLLCVLQQYKVHLSNNVLTICSQVPDYLDVISEPMDLTLVQEKLSGGQYSADAELLADVALVFNNCFTYNKDTHPVAKYAQTI